MMGWLGFKMFENTFLRFHFAMRDVNNTEPLCFKATLWPFEDMSVCPVCQFCNPSLPWAAHRNCVLPNIRVNWSGRSFQSLLKAFCKINPTWLLFSCIKRHKVKCRGGKKCRQTLIGSICTTNWDKDVWNVLTWAKHCSSELCFVTQFTETME